MIMNSNERGNEAFVFGMKRDKENHIAVLSIQWNHLEPIFELLSSPNDGDGAELGLECIDNAANDHRYLMLYNRKWKTPYPLVVVAKYIQSGDDKILVDVGEEDYEVVSFVRDT